MSLFHAVVWTDHHQARILQFDADTVEVKQIKAHEHPTAQHRSGVRSEHEFFGEVCDALEGISELLVTGSRTSVADFKHYADKHRPQAAACIVGYEVVDHMSDNQLLAVARAYFLRHDRMAGIPTPT